MAPKKSSKPSTRIGRASIKLHLKKLLRRRSILRKPKIQRMVRKEVQKQLREIIHTVNLLAGLESTSGLLPNQAEPSAQRRLKLIFVHKLPSEMFTADIVYAIGEGTEANALVRVVLLDENNLVVKEDPLSSLKVGIFVACGDSMSEESKTPLLSPRKEKGSLLVGSCVQTMENGVCSFSDLKFVDNSCWLPSKTFKLVAKVVESSKVPSTVEIREGVSCSFRVKDQRGKSHDKHPIPSWDDKVRHIKKIGAKCNERLKEAGICIVKDFLQKYYIDQSSLKKDGTWETIVQHASKCSPNSEYFRYVDNEGGVELLFDCFYKLKGVSFDHHNHRTLETLTEVEKCRVEQVRRGAFKDMSKLVQIDFPAGWPSANINPWISTQAVADQMVQDKEVLLNNFPSYPQSPLLLEHDQEEPTTQTIVAMEDIRSILRSDSLLRDTLIIDNENHPLSISYFTLTADGVFHGEGSSCRPVGIEAGRVWCCARVALTAVYRFLGASRSNGQGC